jgi:very-short-patch-repair endonuclease
MYEWHRALRGGQLQQLHPGVARLPGSPDSALQRIAAAILAAGSGALASHRSAARLWGAQRPDDDPVDLILPGRDRHIALDGAVVHRPRDGARLTPQRRFNIPCTNILRTLLDLGATDPDGVQPALLAALRANLLDLPAVEVALHEHARPGRAGIRALRDAVAEVSLDRKPVDSVLEKTMNRLVHRYRLPPCEFHPRIAGWEPDFVVKGTAVVLECDGWTSHGLDREQFERDRRKDDDLRAAGWIVVRFTYRAITVRPGDTARRFQRTIDRWSHVPVPAR